MQEKLIEVFSLRLVENTKWNVVYENDTHIFIFNRPSKITKIKPK